MRSLDVTSHLEFHDWLAANVGGPELPGFYVRDGLLVRVPRLGQDGYIPLSDKADDEDGPAQIRPADTTTVRAVIARNYRTYKMVHRREGKETVVEEHDVLPPIDPVGLYVGGVSEHGNVVPPLRGVVHTPFVRPDGTVCTLTGYDIATKILHLPPQGLVLPDLPARLTRDKVAEAVARLTGLVVDFPFVTVDDRANYIGSLLIGPMLRPLVPRPYPFVALSAHMAGSGKTLLGQVSMDLHGGVLRSEPSSRDDEIRKLVTSILYCTSAPLIVMDNLTGTFRSGQFAALATTSRWSDRPLGATAQIDVPNDRIWVLTGNNIALGGDMPRRVPIWARIDADCEDPHLRNGFKVANLRGHIAEHRGQLLVDVLTIVRAWVEAGRPLIGEPRHDSFGIFLRSVAGVLDVVGIEGEFASAKIAREASPVGTEDDEMAEFLTALHDRFPDGFLARDVVAALTETRDRRKRNARAEAGDSFVSFMPITEESEQLLDTLPEDLVGKLDHGGFGRSLGKWMSYRVGQWKQGHVLRKSEDRSGSQRFRVEVR